MSALLITFLLWLLAIDRALALSGPLALALCLRLAASSGFGCWLSGLVLCLRLAASAAAVDNVLIPSDRDRPPAAGSNQLEWSLGLPLPSSS